MLSGAWNGMRTLLLALFFGLGAAPAFALAPPCPAKLTDHGVRAMYKGPYDERYFEAIDAVLSFCYVSGLSFYYPWDHIETSDGQFDWSFIDRTLAIAKKHGKKVNFGIIVATYAPAFVKEKSATFQYTHTNSHVGAQTAPVPWDPYYVERLKRMVAALGQRYNGNPDILFIAIDGPATLWGTETNWVAEPGSISAEDQRKLGFSLPRYRQSWEEMTDAFFAAFPDTDLALALNDGIFSDDPPSEKAETVTEIRDYALAQQKRLKPGRKMWLELLGLSNGRRGAKFVDARSAEHPMTPYMHLAWDKRKEAYIDYQAAVVFRTQRPTYSPEDFALTMELGMAFGAEAIEVKIWDLFNRNSGDPYRPYAEAVRAAADRMSSPH